MKEVKFIAMNDSQKTIYTADFESDPAQCIVSWQDGFGKEYSTGYRADMGRWNFVKGNWVAVEKIDEYVPDTCTEDKSVMDEVRELIGKNNVFVEIEATGGFNVVTAYDTQYSADDEEDLLDLLHILNDLEKYV